MPPVPANIGEEYVYSIVASDPNVGDTVTLSLDQAALDRGMILDGNVLRWTPNRLGEYPIAITADDGRGAQFVQSFTLPVVAQVVSSNPPEFTSAPTGPAYVAEEWQYPLSAVDLDGDAFTFSLVPDSFPAGMTLTGELVTWTPSAVSAGELVRIAVEDSTGAGSVQSFLLPVTTAPVANNAPEITSVPTGPAIVGEIYEYQVVAHDPDGDPTDLRH